jgi:tetratricopeptide (TPR) repeat protein
MKYLFFFLFFFYSFNSYSLNEKNFLIGKNFYKKKMYDKAKIEFEKSIVYNPKLIDSYIYLAKISLELKNLSEEERNLKTAIMLDPKNEEALYLITELYIKEGDYDKAEKNYNILSSNCINFCNKIKSLNVSILKFKQ